MRYWHSLKPVKESWHSLKPVHKYWYLLKGLACKSYLYYSEYVKHNEVYLLHDNPYPQLDSAYYSINNIGCREESSN